MKTNYVETKIIEALQRYYNNGHLLNIKHVEELLKECNFNDFCDLCTAVSVIGFSSYDVYLKITQVSLDYKEKKEIIDLLNSKVNEIFGEELTEIYNTLMKSQKHEQWAGDERYKLFSYGYNPYSEATVIKSAIKMKELYIGKILSLDDIAKASNLMNHGDYWEMYPIFDSDFSDGDERVILAKKKDLDLWHKFMSNIANKNYKEAYQIVKEYSEEFDRIQEMRRNNDHTYYDYLLEY